MIVDYSQESSDRDKKYVNMYLSGDSVKQQKAANYLYNRYNELFLKTAIGKYGLSEHDAEDLVSELWIHIFNKLHTFKAESKFSTWVYQVYKNKFIDLKRSGHFRTISEDMFHRTNRADSYDLDKKSCLVCQSKTSEYNDDPLDYEFKMHQLDTESKTGLMTEDAPEALRTIPFESMVDEDVNTIAELYDKVSRRVSNTDKNIIMLTMQGNNLVDVANELGLSWHHVAKQSSLINRSLREEIENENLDD